jgi:hypothetical protein
VELPVKDGSRACRQPPTASSRAITLPFQKHCTFKLVLIEKMQLSVLDGGVGEEERMQQHFWGGIEVEGI